MSDQTAQSGGARPADDVSRRNVLRAAGAGAAFMGFGGLLAACGGGIKGSNSGSSTKAITIGWIHPLTGSLAGFGAPDNWVIQKVKATSQFKNGIKVGGKTYPVTIKSYDSQSSVTRAGNLARTAILNDNVDLLLASSTPETVNAVASQAESLGTPLICANIPWESWYLNLFPHGNPVHATEKAKYVTMYFLGAEHLAECFIPMWNRIHAQLHTDKVVAAAFPNDSDGNAFRAVFPPIVSGAGYKFDMSSAYPDGTTNYSSMISQFKADKADFFTNVPLPPDFATMWKQAIQQGFRPKLATVAKVLLFPTDAYAMGSEAYNIATDAWWAPSLPWKSSLTGETCQSMADQFETGHGQWNSNISNYSLFESAYAALKTVSDPHDKNEVADAIHKVNIQALAGPLDFASGGPAPGVAITPPVGVQWQKGTKYPLEMQVVDNTLQPHAKITADLLPTNQ
ncbi:MAG TPA: ABC transporter substrate-binding protein [Streptosporangiaceae bacterium]|jgi:branched-chain amino acid transport system substrate-binding protein